MLTSTFSLKYVKSAADYSHIGPNMMLFTML